MMINNNNDNDNKNKNDENNINEKQRGREEADHLCSATSCGMRCNQRVFVCAACVCAVCVCVLFGWCCVCLRVCVLCVCVCFVYGCAMSSGGRHLVSRGRPPDLRVLPDHVLVQRFDAPHVPPGDAVLCLCPSGTTMKGMDGARTVKRRWEDQGKAVGRQWKGGEKAVGRSRKGCARTVKRR